MADASTHVVADEGTSAGKKFKTELTDCSLRHSDTTGPYADNLDVDAIVVGAGFSESPSHPSPQFPTADEPNLALPASRWRFYAQDVAGTWVQGRRFRSGQ